MKHSPFLDELGDFPRLRVIEFFLNGKGLEHSAQDVEGAMNMRFNVGQRQMRKLTRSGMLIQTRLEGHKFLYKLNEKHEDTKKYRKIYTVLNKKKLTKEAAR